MSQLNLGTKIAYATGQAIVNAKDVPFQYFFVTFFGTVMGVPFAIVSLANLLILMVELQSGTALLVHLLGLMLLVGRLAHGYAFSRDSGLLMRQVGMVLTLAAILIAAIANLVLSLG